MSIDSERRITCQSRKPGHGCFNEAPAVVFDSIAINLLEVFHFACQHAKLTKTALHFLGWFLRRYAIDCGIFQSIQIVEKPSMIFT
jgi:hypothetical protein